MHKTNIPWTEMVCNPVVGCSECSPGCENCYAARLAATSLANHPRYSGLAEKLDNGMTRWTGEVNLVPKELGAPMQRRKPTLILMVDMGDLFHPKVPFEYIAAVFGVMAACPQHTFQLLTKRPKRALEWFAWLDSDRIVDSNGHPASWYPFGIAMTKWGLGVNEWARRAVASHPRSSARGQRWPLPNVWFGVSAETQAIFDERVVLLSQIPVHNDARRFVSLEPQLEEIIPELGCDACQGFGAYPIHAYDCDSDLCALAGGIYDCDGGGIISCCRHTSVDWIISGAESGPKGRRRPYSEDWARTLRDKCSSGVPFFYKQRIGANGEVESTPLLDGKRWVEIPERRREQLTLA